MHDPGGRAGPARLPRRRWPSPAVLVAVLALGLAVAACTGGGHKSDGVAWTSPRGVDTGLCGRGRW
jgi:hypothetical protein